MAIRYNNQQIKDVYLGSPNSNCLTYTPHNINLTLSPLNVTVVGSPTINNGVVSGQASGSYTYLPNIFKPENYSWEIGGEFQTGATVSNVQALCGNAGINSSDYKTPQLQIASGNKLRLLTSSNGSSWNITSGTTGLSETVIEPNTQYNYKYGWDGNNYYIDLATGAGEYIRVFSYASTVAVFDSSSNGNCLSFGYSRYSNSYGVFNGSVNLAKSYVKINDKIVWQGGTGALTLKAGSKVYVPNGFEADGTTPKFDEVVIENDVVFSVSNNYLEQSAFVLYTDTNTIAFHYISENTSGTTQPSSNYGYWYDTANNVIKDFGAGTIVKTGNMSFPFCLGTWTNSQLTSIDQVFDWCGYIGSTIFTLPGIKALLANGVNPDGTYKSIELETTKVLTAQVEDAVDGTFYYRLGQNDMGRANSAYWKYDSSQNVITFNSAVRQADVLFNSFTVTSGKAGSLIIGEPAPAKIGRKIAKLYAGSKLVHQGSYPVGTVLVNDTYSGETKTIKLRGRQKLKVELVGGGAGFGGTVQNV